MALWNKVLTGFDPDEETVNFGARAIAENDGSIYESSTLATIQPDGQVTREPNVLASIQYGKLCIAVDKSITIFGDETCNEILLSIGFDTLITCYHISKNGSLLFVAVESGTLYCLHLISRGRLIFSTDIEIDIRRFTKIIKICLREANDDLVDVTFITNNGIIYSYPGLNINHIDSVIIEGDEDALKNISEEIRFQKIFNGFPNNNINYVAAETILGNWSVIMVSPYSIFIWPDEYCSTFKCMPFTYKKIQFFKNYSAFICLCSDGTLSIVCPKTLCARKIHDGPVSDFTTVQDSNNKDLQIVILTKSDNFTMGTLRLVSFPGFKQIFEISVCPTTYLVDLLDSTEDNVIYLEAVTNHVGETDMIRVKSIVEGVPELRLGRLIRREKFAEAEIFARQFQLSMEPIYCKKATIFLDRLGPWAKKDTEVKDLDDFLEILEKIQDVRFIVEYCSKALTADYRLMRKLLLYARRRITQNIEILNSQDESHTKFLSAVNSTLRKLETFEMIQKIQKQGQVSEEEAVNEWIKFSRANIFDMCKTYLSMGELEPASLIWTRHLPEMMKDITAGSIEEILATIPSNLSSSSLWIWLSHFVPSLLSLFPEMMPNVIGWGYRKTKSLEKAQHQAWPDNGIEFANGFVNLLKCEGNRSSSYFNEQYTNRDSMLQKFMLLMQALSDLQRLKYNHGIHIPLDVYMGEPMDVAHLLLNRIHLERIPELIEKFLQQYMLAHNLQNDVVFSLYIQKTIRNSKSWWCWDEAPWEKRVSIVINFIQNIQNRLKQILDALRKAPVPWSATIMKLAEIGSSTEHALSFKIRSEKSHVPVKLILKKYGYESIGMDHKLIRFIIKQNRESMIEDLCELTKTEPSLKNEAFSLCINYHLTKGHMEKVMEIFKGLDDDIISYCCEGIVNYIIACLSLKLKWPECLENYVEMLGYVRYKLQDISSRSAVHSHQCEHLINSADVVKSLHSLRTEFQLKIGFTDYHTRKEKIMEDYIKSLCSEIASKDAEKTKLSILSCYGKITRIAELLRLQKIQGLSFLLEEYKRSCLLKSILKQDQGNFNVTAEECRFIRNICLTALNNSDIDKETLNILKGLCVSALNTCSEAELNDLLDLKSWIDLYLQCFGNYSSDSVEIENNEVSRSKWSLYTIYKDTAISSKSTLFPLVKDALLVCTNYTKSEAEHESADAEIMDNTLTRNTVADHFCQDLITRVQAMQIEHNNYSVLQLVKSLYQGCCGSSAIAPSTIYEIRTTYHQFTKLMLRKLTSARSFDLHLGLSCLFILPETEAYKWLSTTYRIFQGDFARHSVLTTLGYEYCKLMKNPQLVQTFSNQKMLHYWARRLSDYSIPYKETLLSDTEGKRQIFVRIMQNSSESTIYLLQDFCLSFGFNVDDCFMLYLQTLLKNWNPVLKFTNTSGKKELRIDEEEVNDLRSKCHNIVEKIADTSALKLHLSSLWTQINFYHYEIFLIIMDLLNDSNIEKRNYFCFLQNYTRSSKPSQTERDEWMHLSPENTALPAISEWRFPYLPKIEQWKLITPELNLKSYEKWLVIAPVIKLQAHIICTLAIKGEVMQAWEGVRAKDGMNQWSLYTKNSELLEDIKKCIKCMSGQDALYYGTAALYYVVNHTPQGADQVAAAQECYAYAQLAAGKSTHFEEGMLEKIKFKYLKFTSEHILRLHDLGKDTYLNMITNPNKLVRELYSDNSIPERYRSATNYKPDINSAVNALCKLFTLNSMKLRMELLEEWLQPSSEYFRGNNSLTETLPIMNDTPDYSLINDNNLLRACYILENGDTEKSANFLINIGFGNANEGDYGPGIRCRALYVLQSITDTNTLQELTKRDLKTIRQHMKSLEYLSGLESLGLEYSVNTFETCSKYELVQILWKTQYYSPRALAFITQICTDFEIYDCSFWDKLLSQMAKLRMVNELKKVLLQIRSISHVINCSGYVSGWQTVITEPFRKLDINPSPEQTDDCVKSLHLLHSCPIANELGFDDIIEYCFQCKQEYLAVALLPFLKDEHKSRISEKLKRIPNLSNVIAALKDLSLKGVLAIPYCLSIVQDVSKVLF